MDSQYPQGRPRNRGLRWPSRRRGREVRQRPAKPRTPVRIWSAPLLRTSVRAPRRALSSGEAWRLPGAVALPRDEQAVAGSVAAGDAGGARGAGERAELPAAAVVERPVVDAVAARAGGAVEERPAGRRERESMPVAGLAAALELHCVVGV